MMKQQKKAEKSLPMTIRQTIFPKEEYHSLRMSKSAEALRASMNLNIESLGLSGLVREEDIQKKIHPESTFRNVPAEKLNTGNLPGTMIRKKLSKSKKAEIRFLNSANSQSIVSQVSVLVPTKGLYKKASNDPYLAKQISARIMFEVSRLLQKYPDLQSFYDGDELYQYPETNLGYALCIDSGLKVPVFHNCDKMSLDDILTRKDDYIEKYISNTLLPVDLEGGTFTITDLSSLGSWLFNPVLNYMQSCILGIGGENPEGNAYPLVLAFDHRVTDGMTAGMFLNDLKKRLIAHEHLLLPGIHNNPPIVKNTIQDVAEEKIPEKEIPICTKCYRDIDELSKMDHYLLQTVDRNGDIQLVCTLCTAGW
jgi:pyruvate dehydrogenase E2 component (dihydrolipoamide acetyltransferase)